MINENGFTIELFKRIDPPLVPGGIQAIYGVNPPVKHRTGMTEYVFVSAVNTMFSGPETYIFPCDKNGKWLNSTELPGSFRGGMNHEEALKYLGHYSGYLDD